MLPRFIQEEATALLRRLSPPLGQWIEVRAIVPEGGRPQQCFVTTVDDAIAVAERLSGHANVYVAACPRARRKGTRDAVTDVVAFWADVDFHDINPGDRCRAEQIALDRIRSFPIRPSMLVHTGNGLQAWWLLDVSIKISEEYRAARLEGINRGIANALGGDAVHDLARVLRVPGTLNLPDARKRARGCVPVLARLLWADGPTYRYETFRPYEKLEEESPKTPPTKPSLMQESTVSDDEVLAAFRGLLDRLGPTHRLCRTWRGQRTLNDPSRSGWDMALVNQLRIAGVKEEFVPQIVRAFRFGRGIFATDNYICRTMTKAACRLGRQRGSSRLA